MNSQEKYVPATKVKSNDTGRNVAAHSLATLEPSSREDHAVVSTERPPWNIFPVVSKSVDEEKRSRRRLAIDVQTSRSETMNSSRGRRIRSKSRSRNQETNSRRNMPRDSSETKSSSQTRKSARTRRSRTPDAEIVSHIPAKGDMTDSNLGHSAGKQLPKNNKRRNTPHRLQEGNFDQSNRTDTTGSESPTSNMSSSKDLPNKSHPILVKTLDLKKNEPVKRVSSGKRETLTSNDHNQGSSSGLLAVSFRVENAHKSKVERAVSNHRKGGNAKAKKYNDLTVEVDLEQPSLRTEKAFTNDPHPALETPILYFLIRPFPKLLSAIQAFYDMRWYVSYPLQNRIPCSRQLRKINVILTWSELLLMLPFFALIISGTIYSIFEPSVSISGHVARTPLIFCFVSAMKNNFLTLFLGMPVERAIKYHKLSARLAYLNSLLHTFAAFRHPSTGDNHRNFFYFLFRDSVNSGGTLLLFFMTGMIISAVPCIRRKLFEFFYFIHIVFALFMMLCAFYHTGVLVPLLASLTWALDFLIRKVYMPFFRYPREASLQIISDTVVELSLPKSNGFDFNPGQYMYIAIPKLGCLEWHPFSLSSSPKQKMVTFHIRKVGDWTEDLYSLAQKQSDISILMEGPYGSLGVDLTSPCKYQTVMLFSGGIGVTPMQSLCNSLMYEHNHGIRKLRKLSFIWIERDPVVMPEVDVVRREGIRCLNSTECLDIEGGSSPGPGRNSSRTDSAKRSTLGITPRSNADGASDIATQLLVMVSPSQETDIEFANSYPSLDFEFLDESSLDAPEVETVLQHPTPKRMLKSVSFSVEGANPSWRAGDELSVDQSFLDHAFNESGESPLDLQVYLTNKKISRATKKKMAQMPFVSFGRPDIKNTFHSARSDALQNGQHRVAVCVCAPQCIVDLVKKACVKYSDGYVVFDFHFDVFE